MPKIVTPWKGENNAFDRSRSMFDLSDIELITPLGCLCEAKSIEQLFYERAQYIINQARDRKIVISWSGGIDSTAVLTEFLKIAPKSQIVVMLNEWSIKEYPLFYKNYIENQLEIIPMNNYNDDTVKDIITRQDSIIVTGQSLDQIFGDEDCIGYSDDFLAQSIEDFLLGLNSYTVECYTRSINACPVKLKYVKELLWWFSYTVCYQNGELCWVLDLEELILEKNMFHFASNQCWNDYSVSTPMEIKWPGSGSNPTKFKIEIKKHIFQFTKDQYYLDHKLKVGSLRRYRNIKQHQQRPIYITKDWKREY